MKEKQGQRRKKISYFLPYLSCVLLLVSGILLFCAAKIPGFADGYAETIYPVLVRVIGHVTGAVPFSVVEIGLYVTILMLAVTLVRAVLQKKEDRAAAVFSWAVGVFFLACVLFFLYVVNCGVNYKRESFSEKEHFRVGEYTVVELQEVCEWLTEEVNSRADLVSRDADGEMRLDAPEATDAVRAMEALSEKYESLQGFYPRPKKLIVSEILSYQSLTGIYAPFTVEANYNGDMQPYNIPFTACHELSHLRGFMQEQEANFIAFLACEHAERIDFQYSGYLMAWIYSTNALYRADHEVWQEVRSGLDQSVEPDLEANSRFWDSYEGKVSEVANQINDTYLKVNGQSDGVKSYDRMVDLLVSYQKTEQGGRR